MSTQLKTKPSLLRRGRLGVFAVSLLGLSGCPTSPTCPACVLRTVTVVVKDTGAPIKAVKMQLSVEYSGSCPLDPVPKPPEPCKHSGSYDLGITEAGTYRRQHLPMETGDNGNYNFDIEVVLPNGKQGSGAVDLATLQP